MIVPKRRKDKRWCPRCRGQDRSDNTFKLNGTILGRFVRNTGTRNANNRLIEKKTWFIGNKCKNCGFESTPYKQPKFIKYSLNGFNLEQKIRRG